MPRTQVFRSAAILALVLAAAQAAEFSGASALEFTRRIVALGPRTPGSAAHRQMQALIRAELAKLGCQVTEDSFTAWTPRGPLPMTNIIARFPGKSREALAVTGHYDTKFFDEFRFVGANDGGSSAGFLLELARAESGKSRNRDLYLIWFDGEEAVKEWSDRDGLYGSRHLAEKWAADGTLRRIRALINVDMIGDKHLGIATEYYSNAGLREFIWRVARQLGYGAHFTSNTMAVEDDHLPFLRKGVPAVNLIDFDYGPGNSWWHTSEDTMDKLSARSLETVGKVVTRVLADLDR